MKVVLIVAALIASVTLAQAQQVLFDDKGRVAGRVQTDSSGKASVIYDRSGNVTGRTATDSQGNTTIYDARGNKIGSASEPKK
jgi:YD repeat-containing protein